MIEPERAVVKGGGNSPEDSRAKPDAPRGESSLFLRHLRYTERRKSTLRPAVMSKQIEKLHRRILSAESTDAFNSAGRLPVAVVYPNTYYVGMSNLALQWLYRTLNAQPDIRAERIFLPDGALAEAYLKQDAPLLTLETSAPAAQCLAWFVTLSFENDYPNLVRLLRMAGLEPLADKREGTAPLIVAGGTGPMLNPEPLARIVDAVILGEGDGALMPAVKHLRAFAEDRDRRGFYRSLGKLPHAYVPGAYRPHYGADGLRTGVEVSAGFSKRPAILREPSIETAPTRTHVLTTNTEFSDTMLIETYRGCRARCRFCAAGHLGLPPRQRSLPKAGLPDLGQKATGLVGAGVSGHTDIESWIELAARKTRVGISSIRIDTLDRSALERLAVRGAKSVALAPEAGTERLRRTCNKPLTDDLILREARRVIEAGFSNLKLYFLVGLPGENEIDLEAIPDLVMRVRAEVMPIWKERKRAGTLAISVNPFVPKAHTPFQWAPFLTKTHYDRARRMIGNPLKKTGNVQVRFSSYRESRIQALLSRGDRDLADLVVLLADEPNDTAALRAWTGDPGPILRRTWQFDQTLPWDVIDAGIDRDFLQREYHRAEEGKITPECNDRCTLCGICAKDDPVTV